MRYIMLPWPSIVTATVVSVCNEHTQTQAETHSLLGAAEDLAALLCYLSTAAQSVPRLQAVDGVSTALEVAGTRGREEAGRVSGTTLTLMANSTQVLSSGTGRRERDVRLIERVSLALWGNQARQKLTAVQSEEYIKCKCSKNLEEITSQVCTMKSQQCNYPKASNRNHGCMIVK